MPAGSLTEHVQNNWSLRERLPELLWLCSLGITLFWVHDSSDGCARTYQLIGATVPLIDQLAG